MENEKKTEVKSLCPMCGAEGFVEAPLDEEIKDAFLESMLACMDFTRTYDALGGRMEITVKALSDEDNRLRSQMYINVMKIAETTPDIKAYMPLIEAAMDIDSQIVGVKLHKADGTVSCATRQPNSGLMEALNNINWDRPAPTVDEYKGLLNTVLCVFENNVFKDKAIPSGILRASVGKHNSIISRLMRECLDVNFLEGTGR